MAARQSTGSQQPAAGRRDVFAVDEDRALAELKLVWTDGSYHGFSADSGTWTAISSAGDVLTSDTPDALNRAIRADWMQEAAW